MIDCMHIPKGFKLPSSAILVTSLFLWLSACNEAKVVAITGGQPTEQGSGKGIPCTRGVAKFGYGESG